MLMTRMKSIIAMTALLSLASCGGDSGTNIDSAAAPQKVVKSGLKMRALTVPNDGIATYSGNRNEYTITKTAAGYSVKAGNGDTDTLTNIKSIKFADVSVNLMIADQSKTISAADLKSLVELYIAFFNRVPEADGLSYWIDQLKAGQTLDQIAESFYSAGVQYPELTGYSAVMSNQEFVRLIYKNVLGRTGDKAPPESDVQYWSNQLANGNATKGTLVSVMLNSAHSFANDATWGWVPKLLDNKYTVGSYYAIQQGLGYNTSQDSISKTMQIAAAVTATDTDVAIKLVDQTITVIPPVTTPPATTIPKPTAEKAARFLAQATFGPSSSSIDQVTTAGYAAWLDSQFAKPQKLHRNYMDGIAPSLPSGTKLSQNQFFESFWQQAVAGDDQLRQRVTFALSQIFVVSFQDSNISNYPRGVASYYDVLATNAFGNYRNLLEAVSLHPMMGIYLTSLHNQKESGSRVPDENYAREIMQLMSIGLYEINQDGSIKISNGKPVETYTNADITGMAKVFTGWSWAGPDKSDSRFFGGNPDPDRDWKPMQSYPKFHSISEKKFLGTTVAAQGTASPEASLKTALDRLFNHANVGPFIGKQLIQRLVTSNPSPQYVARVAAAFADNGQGVRGDMKAVIKAILLDDEARADVNLSNVNKGKLREPVIRMANWMRAFNAKSTSTRFLLGSLDDPLSALAQTPMRSPSVFNFYRPGYVPPNTTIAGAGLVAPEMQITGETSVTGYLNTMRDVIPNGTGSSRDVKPDYTAELALTDTPDKLLDRIDLLLMSKQMSTVLRNQILAAVNSVTIPANNANNAATARKNRVSLAIFLTMASPEYIVQK